MSIFFRSLFIGFFSSISICTASFVENINIIGNKHTQDHIILREIYHPTSDEFDSTLALEDRNRIYNLGLFSTVEINPIDSSYTVFVVETFRILPLPLLEYEEGKGFSFGAGIAYLNFRGLNEKFILGGIIGEENIYFLNFYNPWVFGNHGSFRSEIYQLSTESAVYNFQYQIKGFEIGTGLYIGEKHRYKADIGAQLFFMDSTTDTSNNIEKFTTFDYYPKYQYLTSKFKYEYDTRDIYTDPSRGGRLLLIWATKLGLNSTSNRMSLNLSYKKYIGLNNIILDPVISVKSQILMKYTKDLPLFEKEYLGGDGFVRGYSPIIQDNPSEIQSNIEGSQIIYESLQLQHTLIKRRDYYRVEAGIDLVYFVDFGISANHINSFQLSNLIYGYGLGLRIFVSGPGVISLDFGYNPYGSWFMHPKDGNY